MKDDKGKTGSIGLIGAMSIGVGGIAGGGFFATFGNTVAGAKRATPISFLPAPSRSSPPIPMSSLV